MLPYKALGTVAPANLFFCKTSQSVLHTSSGWTDGSLRGLLLGFCSTAVKKTRRLQGLQGSSVLNCRTSLRSSSFHWSEPGNWAPIVPVWASLVYMSEKWMWTMLFRIFKCLDFSFGLRANLLFCYFFSVRLEFSVPNSTVSCVFWCIYHDQLVS